MNRRLFIYAVPLVLVWGSMAGSIMIPLQRLPVPLVVFGNLASGFIFLNLYFLITGRFRVIASYSRKLWLRLTIAGFFGTFLYYTAYFLGLKSAGADSAIEVSMMNYLFPIMAVIFSTLILREHVTPLGLLSILISFAGAYVILTKGDLFNSPSTPGRPRSSDSPPPSPGASSPHSVASGPYTPCPTSTSTTSPGCSCPSPGSPSRLNRSSCPPDVNWPAWPMPASSATVSASSSGSKPSRSPTQRSSATSPTRRLSSTSSSCTSWSARPSVSPPSSDSVSSPRASSSPPVTQPQKTAHHLPVSPNQTPPETEAPLAYIQTPSSLHALAA